MPGGDQRRSPTVKIVLVVLILIVLTRVCASDTDQATAPAPAPVSTEERFVSFIRDNIPGAASKSDDELIRGGYRLCEQYDRGMTTDQIAVAGAIQGLNLEELGVATVAAVRSFCPRHIDQIE